MRTSTKSLFLLLALAACGREPAREAAPKDGAKPGQAQPPAAQREPLGELTLAGHSLRVIQVAPVVAGKEGDFDIEVAGTGPLPVVRGWVGVEGGAGSRRVRFEKETERGMHGHPEVPDPIPKGARLWLEVEDGGKKETGSVAFKG
jgi:hypothetical protein